MSKKHFVQLADCLKRLNPAGQTHSAYVQWGNTINAIADVCAADNPRFDRGRWLKYIAGQSGGRK